MESTSNELPFITISGLKGPLLLVLDRLGAENDFFSNTFSSSYLSLIIVEGDPFFAASLALFIVVFISLIASPSISISIFGLFIKLFRFVSNVLIFPLFGLPVRVPSNQDAVSYDKTPSRILSPIGIIDG